MKSTGEGKAQDAGMVMSKALGWRVKTEINSALSTELV